MIYVYDGSFEGLLTVIFNSYKVLEDVDDIVKKDEQIDFISDRINCVTEKDNVGVARDLNEKGFATSIKEEKIIVDLTDKNQTELLNAINEMGLKIDNYGIFKPTLSDIFVEYAR